MPPRGAAYAALAGLALLAALVVGRAELVAVAAPFAVAAAAARLLAREPKLTAAVALEHDRVVEGDEVTIRIDVGSETGVARTDLLLLLPPELTVVDGFNPVAIRLGRREQRTLELRVACNRWGGHDVGRIRFRTRDALGLHTREGALGRLLALRVYPRAEDLRALLPPLETQVFVGNQVSRLKGEGIEFADLRPFAPGDRPRRINWRASARRGALQVNEQHPEQNADVVLFLDTFAELRRDGEGTLDHAVRAAASLTARYLKRKDRVGLVSFGGLLSWLVPSAGMRQLYRIADALIQTDVVLSFTRLDVDVLPPRTLPPKALVIALTPLLDTRSTAALLDLRARGFDLAVLEISPVPFVEEPRDELGRLAYRLWLLKREALRARYEANGVPVVEWRYDAPLDAAIEEVRSYRRLARTARA
jgi:uncharacterized protein (DUF58 family)